MSKQSVFSPRTVFVNPLLMTKQMKINPILNQQKTPISKSWRFYYLFGNSNMLASIVQKYISRKYIMAYDTYSSNYVVIVRRKGHF